MQLSPTKMNMKKTFNQPIGVFDSGLGGLTVLKYLLEYFPNEDFIYLGDLANLPYGNKSQENIIKYSIRCSQFLESKKVKAIIIACNTASSYAYDSIKKYVEVPVFDVISPSIKEIIKSKSKKVAILGTEKTIESNIYANLIKNSDSSIQTYNKACPLFVPIVEEGVEGTKITQSIIDHYLNDIKKEKIDKLILGCTHYPILIQDLKNYFGSSVSILHSGPIIAKILHSSFKDVSSSRRNRFVSYYVTDLPHRFQKYGNKFLSKEINLPELVVI